MTTDIIEPGKRQPRFKRSYETSQLVEFLSNMKQGDQVTYGKLSALAGIEIHGASSALISARRIILNEYGFVIEPIWGVGMKRLTDEEIVQHASKGTRRLAKGAKNEIEKLAKTEFDILNDDAKRKYATHQSVFGAIASIASSKGVRLVEQNVVGEIKKLPLKETLALFQDKKKET